jgi:hypothetical protein
MGFQVRPQIDVPVFQLDFQVAILKPDLGITQLSALAHSTPCFVYGHILSSFSGQDQVLFSVRESRMSSIIVSVHKTTLRTLPQKRVMIRRLLGAPSG